MNRRADLAASRLPCSIVSSFNAPSVDDGSICVHAPGQHHNEIFSRDGDLGARCRRNVSGATSITAASKIWSSFSLQKRHCRSGAPLYEDRRTSTFTWLYSL